MGLTREAVKRLETEYWFAPLPDDYPDFEVCIRPNRIGDAADAIGGVNINLFCKRVFTNFKGYEDGGQMVPNSLQMRLELMTALKVRRAVLDRCGQINDELLEGESGAASD